MSTPAHSPILYVEDEPDDVFFMIRACKHAGIESLIQTVPDGHEAIRYLSGEGKYANRDRYPLPRLVLLDLHMPDLSGFDVLRWIRNTPHVASIPVLVLTSSSAERDIGKATELGANGYLVKPGSPDELLTMTKALRDYWLTQDRISKKIEEETQASSSLGAAVSNPAD